MKSQVVFCTLLALFVSFPALGQRGGRGTTPDVQQSRRQMPDLSPTNVFLTGKVVLDDGNEPTEGAAIQTICGGQKHTEAMSDSHGNFSFQFTNRLTATTGAGLGDADTTMWTTPLSGSNSKSGSNRNVQDCELQAVLPGFTSRIIELNPLVSTSGNTNVGRIVLHRIGQVQGLTISATSAAAPGAARKAFEKGIKQEQDQKWEEAQHSFENAVRIYEKYAVAWFELGRVQLHKNDLTAARGSFDTALGADPNYVSPYQQLAQLSMKERKWEKVVEITDKLLALNPVNFPDAWFFNGVGNYLLKNLSEAEKSARQGLKVDEEHHVPKLEYLLGMVLMGKRDYTEAAAHFRQFLQTAKTPADADEARRELAEVERLSTTASVPSVADQK
jgi:tetratricopeptide (TPR) repeat protein